MPGVLIENNGYFKDILKLIEAQNLDCNWLITDLDCHDYCGWEGSEKWCEETLFLTNEQFFHDVNLRNSQFVWGIFSAIPTCYTKEQAMSCCIPEYDVNDVLWYTRDVVHAQHPYAILEISSVDSSYVTVISEDNSFLLPLFSLPEKVIDLEQDNRITNAATKRIRKIMNNLKLSDTDKKKHEGNLIFSLFHGLFETKGTNVDDETLKQEIIRIIKKYNSFNP